MPKASPQPATPSNRNAPTPSTRLLPSQPQREFFALKPPAYARKPQTPVPHFVRPGAHLRGVLVLARPSDRETERCEQERPNFPLKIRGKYLGTQGLARETAGYRDAASAVSNNRVNEV